MVVKISDILLHNNSVPIEFILKNNYSSFINEDNEYIPKSNAQIPRFTLKGIEGFEDIPINKPVTPTEDMIITAIKYGLIFNITYKGAKDTHFSGHERVIYPMVFGKSSPESGGNLLIRGWHLKGWSVSNNRNIEKLWRMFRFDRFKSITFTGSFYRLPPNGYNMFDKGMRGGIIARADFNEIRNNQQELLKKNEIQNREDVELDSNKNEFTKIKVKNSGTELDVLKPYDNPYIEQQKNDENLRITFVKSIYGETRYAILGALGQPGNTIKIVDEKDKELGMFKVVDSIGGKIINKITSVKSGNSVYQLYFFEKKL